MRCKSFPFFVLMISALYLFAELAGGCAQIGSPTGGPRDSLPPVLLGAVPENRTTNFSGKTITLSFDEYVQVRDIQKNLLVSPTPTRSPDVNWKLRDVTIRIRDTLQPNTTYVIDLGNAVQDINENNPYRNYKYVFSTGSYIDSLTFSGNVKLAETGKVDSTLIVMLYSDLDDSAVLKHKPRYIARLDSSGNFAFTNLAGGTYNIFALKDEGGQKYYSNKTYLFAFADSVIVIDANPGTIGLLAYNEEKPVQKGSGTPAPVKDKPLKLLPSAGSAPQDLLTPLTLTLPTPLADFDTAKITLQDTLFNEYSNARISLDSTRKIVSIIFPWQEDTDYRLLIEEDFATDSAGNKLIKPDTLAFKTKKESDYGTLKLNFTNLEKYANPVLQFITNNNVVNSFPLTGPSISVRLFNPGDYEMRILEDRNQNGKWDPGNYAEKLQPEKVLSINQKINIRANWDNEKDIIL